jgi:hypothetical protein
MKTFILFGAALIASAALCAEPPSPAEPPSLSESPASESPQQNDPPAQAPAPSGTTVEAVPSKTDSKETEGQPSSPAAEPEAETATSIAPPSPEEDAEFAKLAKTYTKVEQKGKTMYCRKEYPLGSRLPVTQCLTEAELASQARSTGQLKEQMRTRPKGLPPNAG